MDGRHGRAALAHPLFWTALAVLVVNDHLLKGAGWLPTALTGKLSDFAGLIVAPVFVTALLGARTRRAIAASFALATIPFVVINLSPAGAHAAEALVGAIGIAWQVTCDPTDLVGLTMLPIAYLLVTPRHEQTPARSIHRATERTLLIASAIACMATSNPPPGTGTFQTDLFVVNTTDVSVDLRVRWVEAALDCDVVARDPAHALARGLFTEGTTFAGPVRGVVPLDRTRAPAPAAPDATDAADPARDGCDALLIQADGLGDTLVFWNGLTTSSVPTDPAEMLDMVLPGRVDLVADGAGGLTLVPSSDSFRVQVLALEAHADEAPACEVPIAEPLAWSETFPTGEVEIAAVAVGPDGCTAIDLASRTGGRRVFVCAPSWALPLAAGDRVSFQTTGPAMMDAPSTLRIVRSLIDESTRPLEVVLYTGIGVALPDIRATVSERAECHGARAPCDAFTIPAALAIQSDTGRSADVESALPGDVVDVTTIDGRAARLYVGRAEQVAVAPPMCGSARAALGARVDLLVLYDEGL